MSAQAKFLRRNSWGGRNFVIYLPLPIYELATEISARITKGEITAEGEARTLWLAKVQPWIQKALSPLTLDPIRDLTLLRPASSISNQKTLPHLHRPSAKAVASFSATAAVASSSLTGRSPFTSPKAGS